MKTSPRSILLKIAKITGITAAVILLLMILTPFLFPSLITEQIKKWTNQHIEGELNFSKARLSFFHRFPSLTLSLYDFSLKGSKPFSEDTLIASERIALGVNLKSLFFDKKIMINKVFLTKALINVQVNEKGQANYNVYVSDKENKAVTAAPEDSSSTTLKIRRIEIVDSRLLYNDRSVPVLIDAKGLNYTGNGDLSEDIFDLYTHATIDSFDFYLDKEPYVLHKKINAELVTKINTSSLAFIFEKNKLLINRLPLEFTGKFDFLSNGYQMDFNISSGKTNLYNVITALPPSYNSWLEKANVKGTTEVSAMLNGSYIVSENKKPDFIFRMKLNDGYVAYDKVPLPASDIITDLEVRMPSLNVDSLQVKMDTLSLKIDKDYIRARFASVGIANPEIAVKGNLHTEMDLEKLDKAFGFAQVEMKGNCKISAVVDGSYVRGSGINGLSPKQFPEAAINISLKNGSIQTEYYPRPIDNIALEVNVKDPTGTLKDLEATILPASFEFEGKPFTFKASLKNFEDINYDISANGELDFQKIYSVFSQEGLDVKGFARADLHCQGTQSDAVNGRYQQLKNEGSLDLKEIAFSSALLPKPFVIEEGLFRFREDKMLFNGFLASYGASDFRMDGYLQNVINYILAEDGKLKGSFSLDSRFINVDEFMQGPSPDSAALTPTNDSANTVASGVVMIPGSLNLNIKASAAKVAYKALTLQDFKGGLTLNNAQAALTETGFNLIGCKVLMNATYTGLPNNTALFQYKIQAKDFDVQRAYKEIAMFRDMAPAAENAQGTISLDYALNGKLNSDMYPVFPSLSGGGVLTVKEAKVKGYKLFNAVGSKTGNNDIKDPSLKNVDLKTTIKNNIITLERVKMKVAGFRPRIEGQTSFDGRLNLKMRLGLPPLGIIGIPITITGTSDAPVIKLGRKTEDLAETEDDSE